MALICVKNTFITLVPSFNNDLSESLHTSSTATDKRSSSAPPKLATKVQGRPSCGFEPKDDDMTDLRFCASPCIFPKDIDMTDRDFCATPCIFSPRSLESVQADMTDLRFCASPCIFPKDIDMTDRDFCATPCIFSPRSDFSTTASSDPNGLLQARRPAPLSDSESAADTFNFDSLDTQTPWEANLQAATPEIGNNEIFDAQDCISTGEYKDFSITLNKAGGDSLGMDLDRSDGISLFIRSVTRGGLVTKFNQANPDQQLLEGDRIVMVNSVSGSALELLRECQRRNVLRFRVLRNARPELLTAIVAAFFTAQSSAAAMNILETGAPAKAAGAAAAATVAAPMPSAGGSLVRQGRGKRRGMRSEASTVATANVRCGRSQATLRAMGQADSPSMNVGNVAAKAGLCAEVKEVLRTVARQVISSPLDKVKNVQLVEGTMGSSSAINIEVMPPYVHGDAQGLCALVKSSLLDAAAQSENTYLVGYLGTPFCAVGESSFRATIAKVPNGDNACWDFYQKGFCPRPSTCRWCHPEGVDLMTLWVNLKF